MRETINCSFVNYSAVMEERKNFGWRLVEQEQKGNYYRITFEMDDNLSNKEELLLLYNQYKLSKEPKKPHTVASFVWGTILMLPFYICLIAFGSLQEVMKGDGGLVLLFAGLPAIGGLAMILTGILYRVKYCKKVKDFSRQRDELVEKATCLLMD